MERCVSTYLDHLTVERGVSAHTSASYRRDLARYVAYLDAQGIATLADVDPATASGFARWLSDGDSEHPPLAPASVARAVVAMRGLHKFALQEGVTATNPTADVRGPQTGRHLPKALTVDAVQRLLDAPDRSTPQGLRDAALLELLYGTGARISEVCALDVDDVHAALVDADAGLRLFGKGAKERVVPLGSFARDALDAWLVRGRPTFAARGSSGGPALLLNTRGGRLSRQSAWGVLREQAARAGLSEDISPHTLRHSYATHLLDGGADVRVVQELLGHASVTTTQIYTLVTVDQLREVYLAAHPRAR